MKPPDALVVAEYTALRAEILQAQQTRAVLLALVSAALGALASVGLGTDKGAVVDLPVMAAAVSGFSLLVVIAAAHFTTILTYRIDVIAEYIRQYVEHPHGGMWETRWSEVRSSSSVISRFGQPPLATSKAYAIYYGVLAVGATGEFWLAGGDERPILFAIPVLLLVAASCVCYGLYSRPRGSSAFSRGETEPTPELAASGIDT